MSSAKTERRRPSLTTGTRLTLWHSAFFVFGCVAVYGMAYSMLAASLERRDREAILAKFWDLAGEYQDSGVPGMLEALVQQRRLAKTRPFFVQFARPGARVAQAGAADWNDYATAALDALPDDGRERWTRVPSNRGGSVLDVLSLRLTDGFLLRVGQDDSERREVLARFRNVGIWSLALALLMSLVGGYLMAARALRPVRDLIDTIGRIESGAVGARVPSRGSGDEFDELGRLFNGMLSRIETLISGMRGALDNVAHDLRTPLTRLRAGAEGALSGGASLEEAREALADCVDESDRVVGMVETLMDISEAETGIMKLRPELFDLRELADETVELYQFVAEEKKVALSARHDGAIMVHADRNRLRQALANLVDNAVKYGEPGCSVIVETAAAAEGARVVVSDTGVGIPPEEIGKVWDRLYRGDASRSQRGLGLGLSLVKAVVIAHGGRVAIESAPGRGSRFSFVLPAA